MASTRNKFFIFGGLTVGVLVLGLFMSRFTQDMPKNEIKILIDRVPNTLDGGQAPDTMAQRILPLISEFHYRLEPNGTLEEFKLLPEDSALPQLHFLYVRDELSRAMLFMGHRADVLYDTLSLSKTAWIRKHGTEIIEGPGLTISFLGFQLGESHLKDHRVRQAIQYALPVEEWIRFKLFNWVDALPGAHLSADLTAANQLLDEAGFPKGADGIRFSLHYLTTPVREGNETAFLVREALKGIGIHVEIQPLETSLFFNRLKRGDFDLFSSRLYRSKPSDPVSDFLAPKGVRNYFQYTALPDKVFGWDEVKEQVFRDLPIVPLYTWRHGAVISERITFLPGTEQKLDDSFRFLNSLRLK